MSYTLGITMTHTQGLTLLEALMSLTIIAILTAISLPAARNFYLHTQDETLQKQLLHAIEISKQEAIAHHARVALCQSNNQMTCTGSWEQGQLVFLDEYMNGMVLNHEQIISVIQTGSQHGRIFWRSFPRYRNYLVFLATGLMKSDNGTFWHCHADLPMWALLISKSGRVRIVYPNEKNELKDGQLKPLTC